MLACGAWSLPLAAQNSIYTSKLAPYVSSPVAVVDRMLEMANMKPGETLYDLGCGDGRVLISAVQKYHVKAVGVEISPKIVAKAQASIRKAGLETQATVLQGNLLDTDLTGADVVIIYLSTPLNAQLRPRLEKYLKPGSRVVSHDYAVPGWKATKIDKAEGNRPHSIYLYEMPAIKN